MKKIVSYLFSKDSLILLLVAFLVGGFCACAKQKNDVQILTPISEKTPMLTPQASRNTLPQINPYPPNSSYKPKDGFVPNEATAIKIAEAIIVPIWGTDCLKNEQPFTALLVNGTWIVTGTLPSETLGGTAYVEISKETGSILNIAHGK